MPKKVLNFNLKLAFYIYFNENSSEELKFLWKVSYFESLFLVPVMPYYHLFLRTLSLS